MYTNNTAVHTAGTPKYTPVSGQQKRSSLRKGVCHPCALLPRSWRESERGALFAYVTHASSLNLHGTKQNRKHSKEWHHGRKRPLKVTRTLLQFRMQSGKREGESEVVGPRPPPWCANSTSGAIPAACQRSWELAFFSKAEPFPFWASGRLDSEPPQIDLPFPHTPPSLLVQPRPR